MIPRSFARRRLRSLLRANPAVALVGPRQCGKTTLARSLGGHYFDLEQPTERTRLDVELDALARENRLLILDEAQTFPEIFPRLRGAIDARRRRNGRFLLLGSVSPGLMREVSESLAGRLALCELSPFLVAEDPRRWNLDRMWLTGGFPAGGILKPTRFPSWQTDYLHLLAQRDLPNWGLPSRPQTTLRFFELVAAAHGTLWNAAEVGRGIGLTHPTVNAYLDYLEGAFLVRRLRPFSGSVRKRLIRSPKIYWRDSGLLHALLGANDLRVILVRPWAGLSWEGFVIEQVLAALSLWGRSYSASFFRTSDGREIDLVLDLDGVRLAIEVKLTASPAPEDLARAVQTARLVKADRTILVSRVARPSVSADRASINLPGLLVMLHSHFRRANA